MVHRRGLLAYLIAAGVAGTLLIGPYGLRFALIRLIPGANIGNAPFFLLPVLWGLWNLAWTRWRPGVGIGTWGALVGVMAGVGVNLFFLAEGTWFRAALLLPLYLPVLYFLLWRLVVGPLNEALGVTEEHVADAR